MRIDKPLDDIFHGQSYIRALRALYELPEGFPASAREIGRRAGLSHPTASRVLASLADQGIVQVNRTNRADLYEIQQEHVASRRLKTLFDWERELQHELASFLRHEIMSRTDSVTGAFLFGSVVRGEMTATSDIDVAVVCDPDAVDQVLGVMEHLEEALRGRFGNRLSFVVGTADLDQLGKSGRKGYRLWRQIAVEGLPIIGPSKRGPVGG